MKKSYFPRLLFPVIIIIFLNLLFPGWSIAAGNLGFYFTDLTNETVLNNTGVNHVKAVSPNDSMTGGYFFNTTGGKPLIVQIMGVNGQNDLVTGAPYGGYNGLQTTGGAIFINKGPLNSTSPNAGYFWDSGDWSSLAPVDNVSKAAYIVSGYDKDRIGYALDKTIFNGVNAMVFAQPGEVSGSSTVAVILERTAPFNRAYVGPASPTGPQLANNVINMRYHVDLRNFTVLVKGLVGGQVASYDGVEPPNVGISLACGDVNNDGVEDIVIGCPKTDNGYVYVIFGKNAWSAHADNTEPTIIDVGTMATTDGFRIAGDSAGEMFGASVCVADIYGDGKNELMIGAPYYDGSKGRVVIIPDGSVGAGWGTRDYSITNVVNAKVIAGNSVPMRFGHKVAAGKFHDSAAAKKDIVVAEYPNNDVDKARLRVFYGNATTPSFPMSAVTSSEVTFIATLADERFGYALACGDVNGDGFDDIAASAPLGPPVSPDDPVNQNGKVYLIHGRYYYPGTVVDFSNQTGTNKAYRDAALKIEGSSRSSLSVFFGYGLAIGEVGGPGANAHNELVISGQQEYPYPSTTFTNPSAYGATYVFYTSKAPNKPTINQLATPTKNAVQVVTWSNFADPEGDTMKYYQVQFSSDKYFKDFSKIIDSGVIGTYDLTVVAHNVTLADEGRYHYRVRVGDRYSFSQFSDTKEIIYDKTPPTGLTATAPTNMSFVPPLPARAIKATVTDAILCNTTINAEIWVQRLNDKNGNGIWDDGDDSTTVVLNKDSGPDAVTSYTGAFNETALGLGANQLETIEIIFTGSDAAQNLISESIGGAKATPKVTYFIHSTNGPVVNVGSLKVYKADNTTIASAKPNGDIVTNTDVCKITTEINDDDGSIVRTSVRMKFTPPGIEYDSVSGVTFLPVTPATPDRNITAIFNASNSTSLGGDGSTVTYQVTKADDEWGYAISNAAATVKNIIIDKSAPGSVTETTSPLLNNTTGPPMDPTSYLARSNNRLIKFTVSDAIWVEPSNIVCHVKIGANPEVQAPIVNPPAAGPNPEITFKIDDTTAAPGQVISVWITGTDFAGNAITPAIGGSEATPKVKYAVHSDNGPTVGSWNVSHAENPIFQKFPNNLAGRYYNDKEGHISCTLTDDDSTVSNIILKVQGVEYAYGVSPLLFYDGTTLTLQPAVDTISDGTVDVSIKSATDYWGNQITVGVTSETFFLDRAGPIIVPELCQPLDGGSTGEVKPKIVFAVSEPLSGIDDSTVSIKLEGPAPFVTVTYTYPGPNNCITVTPSPNIPFLSFITINTSLIPIAGFNDGTVKASLRVADRVGNLLNITPYVLSFTVNTAGPKAVPWEPWDPSITKIINNNKNKIRIKITTALPGSENINKDSVQIKVNSGVTTILDLTGANKGCKPPYLDYDTLTCMLTYDPVQVPTPLPVGVWSATYPEGVNTVTLLEVNDILGNRLQGRPLTWNFICDTIGPVAGTDTVPAKDAWVTNRKQIVKMKVTDATTKVKSDSIKLKVYGVVYNTGGSPCLSFDPLTGWITFDPATVVSYDDKTVEVELTEAYDEANNLITASANNKWSFKVDATRPVASNFTPAEGTNKATGVVPIIVRLTDNFSGVDTATIEFKVNNSLITPASYTFDGNGDLKYTNPAGSPYPEGKVTCEITFKDVAGNVLSPSPTVWTFNIDKTRMTVLEEGGYPYPAPFSILNNPVNTDSVWLKVSKTYSALDTYSISVKGGIPEASINGVNLPPIEGTNYYLIGWRTNPPANFPEGTVTVTLNTCKNKAGWDIAAPYSWKFQVDLTPPVLDVDSFSPTCPQPKNNTVAPNAQPQISLKLTDALSGVDVTKINLTVNGQLYNVDGNILQYNNATGALTFNPPVAFPDGMVTVTLNQGQDRAKNDYTCVPEPNPFTWFFFVDVTGPTATFTKPIPAGSTVPANTDSVEATITDGPGGQGIKESSIKLTIVSTGLAISTIENVVNNPGGPLTFSDGKLVYKPPVPIPDSKVDVYLWATDNAGLPLQQNPTVHNYFVDTTGPVIIAGSRNPIPEATIGVNIVKVVWRFKDIPSGINVNSLGYKFTLDDGGGIIKTDTDVSHVTSQAIDANTVEFSYNLPNATITAAMLSGTGLCTMEILALKDSFGRDLQNLPENKWRFYIDNTNPVASAYYPPDGSLQTDNAIEAGITVFHSFGIMTSSIEFLYNGNTANFLSSPANYLYNYNTGNSLLSFKPLGDALDPLKQKFRWAEGTNTVTLMHAREKVGNKDIVAPVTWSFKCDTTSPLASINSPLADAYFNQNSAQSLEVLINLTDDPPPLAPGKGSGIDPSSVTFEIKKPGETAFTQVFLNAGSNLSYANNILKYVIGTPVAAGTYEVKLSNARDLAGHNCVVPGGGGLPLTWKFSAVTGTPLASISQPLSNSIVDNSAYEVKIKFDLPAGSPGMDTSSIELEVTQNTDASVIYKVLPGSGLTYDGATNVLTYRPVVPFNEGKMTVKLKKAKDLTPPSGNDYVSSPPPTPTPLTWQFTVDTKAPKLLENTVTPKMPQFALNETQEISMTIDDGVLGSGVDTGSIRIRVKYYPNNNPGVWTEYERVIGTYLTFQNNVLKFYPEPPYAEGSVSVTLVSCKDLAGHNYISDPTGKTDPDLYTFEFMVDLKSPTIMDGDYPATFSPGHISEIKYINANNTPITMKIDDARGSTVNDSTIKLNVNGTIYQKGSNLAYDKVTQVLRFTPPAVYPEGSVSVELVQCQDYAGRFAISQTTALSTAIRPPGYSFSFVCDTVNPDSSNPIPTPNSFVADRDSYIYIMLRDLTSGIGTYSVTVLDKNGTILPITQNTYNPSSYVLTVKTQNPLPEGAITVKVENCEDRAKNKLNGTGKYEWSFDVDTNGPTVDMIDPLPLSRVNDNLKRVTLQFGDAGSGIDPASIVFTVRYPDSSSRSFNISQPDYLTFDAVSKKLVFNPASNNLATSPAVPYAEGTISVSVSGRDRSDHAIAGTTSWRFQVDSKGPYVVEGSEVPIAGSTSGSSEVQISLRVRDDLGTIKAGSISLKLENLGAPAWVCDPVPAGAVSFDAATGTITVRPDLIPKTFTTGQVRVTVKNVTDDIDNDLQGKPYSWTFNMNTTTPYASDPLIMKIVNNIVQPAIPANNAQINSTQFITSMRIHPQQPGSTTDTATIRVRINTQEYAYNTTAMNFTTPAGQNYGVLQIDSTKLSPAAPVRSNDTNTVTLVSAKNNLGTDLASPFTYSFVVDTVGPTTGVEYPSNGSIFNDPQGIARVEVLDPPRHSIDVSKLKFSVNGTVFTSSSGAVTYNNVTRNAEFNPAAVTVPAHFCYVSGQNTISLVEAYDLAGNAMPSQKTWNFILDDTGPVAILSTAAPNNVVTANDKAIISIKVTSASTSIRTDTFLTKIINSGSNGITNSWNILGTDEVRGVTYNTSTGIYAIDLSKYPLQLVDGRVQVQLLAVQNEGGNNLQNPTLGGWEFYLDKLGPKVLANSPGAITTSNKSQPVSFTVTDLKSNLDLVSMKLQVVYQGGTKEVGVYDPGCDYSVSLGKFTYDPSKVTPPFVLPEGTATVILSQAKDVLGNALQAGALNTFQFNVNTRGPVARDPIPRPGTFVSGVFPVISFQLVSQISAVDPSKPIRVRVNGVTYSTIIDPFNPQPTPLTYSGDRVIFNAADAGIQFGSGQILVEVLSAQDLLGNTLRGSDDPLIGPSNSWIFTNDVTPPVVSAPVPQHLSVVGTAAPVISVTIRDNYVRVDDASIRLKINGGAAIVVPAAAFNHTTHIMTFDLSNAPGSSLAGGQNTIEVSAVRDILGNAITQSYAWSVYLDREPPYVVANTVRPVSGSTGNILRPVISFNVADNPVSVFGSVYSGDVDFNTIRVRVVNNTLDRTLKYGDAGVTYVKPQFLVDTSVAGITLTDGSCEVYVLGGNLNGMADAYGNRMAADFKFDFAVISSGPYMYGTPTPAPESTVTNNKPMIRLNLRSDKSQINASSIQLQVDGTAYGVSARGMSYAGETLTFDPAAAGITLREGTVEVRLLAAEDLVGNKLKQDPNYRYNPWYFRVDTTGPTATIGANPVSTSYPTTILFTSLPSEQLSALPSMILTYGDAPNQTTQSVSLFDTFGNATYYSGTLELSTIPRDPVRFTFVATDIHGVQSQYQIQNFSLSRTQVMSPVAFKPQKPYLIGLPVVPSATAISSVLSGFAQNAYTIWEGAESNRKIATSVRPGVGYWVLNTSGADAIVKASGYEMPAPMLKFDIELKAGWNIVSFPYNGRVSLQKCRVKCGAAEAEFFSTLNTFTEHAMWSYDYDINGKATYSLNHSPAHIMPFSGYYIYAKQDCTLRVPPTFVTNDEVNKYPTPPYGISLQYSNSSTERNLWYKMGVSCEDLKDDYNYFGIHELATDGTDADYDLLEPPSNPIGQGYYLSAFMAATTGGIRYGGDFRGTSAVRKKWTFTVRTNLSGKTATVYWESLRSVLPFDYEMVLYDRTDGSTINMRNASAYSFTTTGTDRVFTILFAPVGVTMTDGGTTDTAKPYIVGKLPYENASNVPVSAVIYAYFNEKLSPDSTISSITVSNLSSGSMVSGTVYYNESINEISFKPSTNLESYSSYRVTVDLVRDLAGNRMDRASWIFTTARIGDVEKNVKLTIKKGWNLISIPVFPKARLIADIFSDIKVPFVLYGRNGSRITIYNGSNLDSPITIDPGRGYWLYSSSDSDLSVNIAGNNVPDDLASDEYFEIPLSKGFNLLGIPYNIADTDSVAVSGFTFRLVGETVSSNVFEAVGRGYVRNSVYTFFKSGVSGTINPRLMTDVTVKVKKSEGFFIYSERDDLILRVPRKGVAGATPRQLAASLERYPGLRRFAAKSPKLEVDYQKSWRVPIGVVSADGAISDEGNCFGVDVASLDGLDICDVIKLVSPEPYLSLTFAKTFGQESLLLAYDIRSAMASGDIRWAFAVESKGYDVAEGYVRWDRNALPAAGTFTLVDRTMNVETDMRANSRVRVPIDGNRHEFEIIYNPGLK